MDARREPEPIPMKNRTTAERKSERELVVTRTFNGPARIVFEAWTKPELLKRWWAPKSTGVSLLSCGADVRVGGRYRFEFGHDASKPMAFFGSYIEVTPHSRLVWTRARLDWTEPEPIRRPTRAPARGGRSRASYCPLIMRILSSSKSAPNCSKSSQAGLRPSKETQRKKLGFPWILLAELSLFKGLR
jgi:uncharacterized protein YndB with AHSA1/START domain